MTGLADEIRREPSRRKRRNRIHEVLDMLDEADRKALIDALNDENVSGISIVRVLKARGTPIGESTISNYRRGLYGTL